MSLLAEVQPSVALRSAELLEVMSRRYLRQWMERPQLWKKKKGWKEVEIVLGHSWCLGHKEIETTKGRALFIKIVYIVIKDS